jgi:hypothetical protein
LSQSLLLHIICLYCYPGLAAVAAAPGGSRLHAPGVSESQGAPATSYLHETPLFVLYYEAWKVSPRFS